jgi:hypothetical protein
MDLHVIIDSIPVHNEQNKLTNAVQMTINDDGMGG